MTGKARLSVGVMGGMGPDATVDFMSKVIALTDAKRDQDHVHMIIDHDPRVPNRQSAIQAGEDDVSAPLAEMAQRLETAGADFLVMVCNTAHVFLGGVRASTHIPFISIIDESIAEIDRIAASAQTVGVMATTGCIDTQIYQQAVAASGRKSLVPDRAHQQQLMDLINAIKAGRQGVDVQQGMVAVATDLQQRGADVLIAGCTEIPIVFDGSSFSLPVVASTDVLAARTVALAQGLLPLPNSD